MEACLQLLLAHARAPPPTPLVRALSLPAPSHTTHTYVLPVPPNPRRLVQWIHDQLRCRPQPLSSDVRVHMSDGTVLLAALPGAALDTAQADARPRDSWAASYYSRPKYLSCHEFANVCASNTSTKYSQSKVSLAHLAPSSF